MEALLKSFVLDNSIVFPVFGMILVQFKTVCAVRLHVCGCLFWIEFWLYNFLLSVFVYFIFGKVFNKLTKCDKQM